MAFQSDIILRTLVFVCLTLPPPTADFITLIINQPTQKQQREERREGSGGGMPSLDPQHPCGPAARSPATALLLLCCLCSVAECAKESLYRPGAPASSDEDEVCASHTSPLVRPYVYKWCRRRRAEQFHSSIPVSLGVFASATEPEGYAKWSLGLRRRVLRAQGLEERAGDAAAETLEVLVARVLRSVEEGREAARVAAAAAADGSCASAAKEEEGGDAVRAPSVTLAGQRVEVYEGGAPCDARRRRSTVYVLRYVRAAGTASAGGEDGLDILHVEEASPCNYEYYVAERVAEEKEVAVAAEAAVGEEGVHELNSTGEGRASSPDPLDSITAESVRAMFHHAYQGYMEHAYPAPDLLPLSCEGSGFTFVDIRGLTLIDSLDSLVVLDDPDSFWDGVDKVLSLHHPSRGGVGFALDVNASLFETTIRVLGGLLSAHVFAAFGAELLPASSAFARSRPSFAYGTELLDLAVDLGTRLAPAFRTPSGIPYGTVNLLRGVPAGETTVASLAGAGSLSVEFTVLAILSNNTDFLRLGNQAALQLYRRRSGIGLLGKHFDFSSNEWTEVASGIGTNSDSFYEYLFKAWLVNPHLEANWFAFEEAYEAVMAFVADGDFYADIHMGGVAAAHHRQEIEGLAAFWPGVQVLLGDHARAARTLNAMLSIVDRVGFLPEGFFYKEGSGGFAGEASSATDRSYILRPELIESVMYMYGVSRDATWLRPVKSIIESLEAHAKTECGYAILEELTAVSLAEARREQAGSSGGGGGGSGSRKGRQSNKHAMPSFLLSETLKYLYLTLVEAEAGESDTGSWVFHGSETWLFRYVCVRLFGGGGGGDLSPLLTQRHPPPYTQHGGPSFPPQEAAEPDVPGLHRRLETALPRGLERLRQLPAARSGSDVPG